MSGRIRIKESSLSSAIFREEKKKTYALDLNSQYGRSQDKCVTCGNMKVCVVDIVIILHSVSKIDVRVWGGGATVRVVGNQLSQFSFRE